MKHLYIHVISYFQGNTGYNIHAREFTKALEQVVFGKDVSIIKSSINDVRTLENSRKMLLDTQKTANIINICILYGSQCWEYLRLFPGVKIAYTYWESTKLPDDWIEPLKRCDYVWTASTWGRERFIQNGLNSEQVLAIPLGVDPEIFHPQQQPHSDLIKNDVFKFFTVGKCEPRKGTQQLIVAFDLEFHNNPNVFLVLAAKNPFIPKFNLQTFIQHLWLQNYNKFLYTSKGVTHEQLAQIMAACHCGVFPTKAEGWGLPILESMALGKPTIVTNYSGVTEYANENNAILLDYYTIPVDGLFFQRADKDYGMWALPNTNTLRKKMREVYENYRHYQQKFLASSVDVRKCWSWQASAQKAWDVIKIILNKASLAISYEQIEKQLDIGIEHHQSGRLTQAQICYEQVLQWQPNRADAWHLLGVIAYQQEQYPTAIERIKRAIELNGNAANFYNSLGSVYQKQQHFTEALDCYQKVIQLQPDFFKAYNNIGLIYQEIGQLQEAIAFYQKSIQLQPTYAEAYLNLSITYEKQTQLTKALECCQQAIQLQRDYAEAHCQLGKILHNQGQLAEAIQSYQCAIEIKPNYADAYANLGTVLQMQGKLTEAIQSCQKALQLEPNQYQTYNNLGGVFQSQGKLKQAIELFQRAIEINPSDVLAYQNLLFGLHYSSDYEPSAIYAQHRQWAAVQADKLVKVIVPHNNNRKRERRLRIGYVSGDFKTHSVAYFFEPLLANRNCNDFEVICYANNSKTDATTQRLWQLADGWREIYARDDEQVAELVRQDKIDILVDLSGHTKDNRLLVFARKPAPVQVTYIGYPNTTGLDTIDYRITDAWADPKGETEHLHIEQLMRLPHGFLCYLPSANCPDVSPPPFLKTGQITFGCFNNLAKVNPELISWWAEILKAVANSRMIIKYKSLVDPDTCAYVHGLFQQYEIEDNRVELIGWLPDQTQHLALYERVDIALDTFPYHGTTTTCEAMWMGVSVITLAGKIHVSRVGVSLLSSVGLEEAIAQSPQEYIQKAIALAKNKARLQELRENLRSKMQASPLTNASLIAGSLEDAYRIMWRCFCAQTLLNPDERLVAITSSLEQIFQSAINHHQAGYLQQAEQEYQQVLQQQPDRADAWHLLGVIAAQQKQYQTAIERINRAIKLKPEAATFYSNLGNAYQEQGKLSEAIACYQKVIQLQPNHVDTYKNMGIALKEQGQLEEAVQAYKQVIQLKPDYADAHYNLANTLQFQGKLKEAIQALQKTIQLDPNHPQAYNNLAGAWQSQGKLKEAIECFQKALQIKPDYAIAYSNMLFSLHYNSDYDPSAIYAEHRKWAALHASALAKAIQPHNNNLNPERRLRIGYVSGDFFTHSVAYFFEPLLTAHNRNNFEIICYANNSKIDATNQRLQQLADGWREIYALDDEQVAALIRQDEIDILVDLSGHTKDNRLLMFARKPAPVQVTYIGYPNTTGLDTIDYRITDAWADPQGQTEHLHAEKLVRLPHGFLCYLPADNSPQVSSPPVFKNNQITFGCFNNLAKINPQLIACWAEILQAVPNSRIIIKSKPLVDPDTCAYLHQLFEQQGIATERVELLGWLPDKNQHLTLYDRVDIALDTFPYHGTTTTCEAMWMGVPVITQAGSTHLSRVGVSLLSSVGLEEAIAQSAQDYIQKAVNLANHQNRLQELRGNLRQRMLAAPLTDAYAIAHSLEKAYRKMWRHWCEHL